MINKKVSFKYKPLFFLIFINVILVSIFFIDMQLFPKQLGICDNYKEHKLVISEFDLTFNYPTNECDDKYYFSSVESLRNLFNEKGNAYQNRPLYIIPISFINNFLKSLTVSVFEKGDESPILSFLIFQILLLSTSETLFFKIINKFKKINLLEYILVTIIIFLFPLFRYEIFKTSNQTLALAVFVVALYLIVYGSEKYNFKKYIYLGILFLFNRSFFISFFYILINNFTKNRFKLYLLFRTLLNIFLFSLPALTYSLYKRINNFDDYDINTTVYGQFVWLKNYVVHYGNALSIRLLNKPIFEYKNFESEWHCTAIPNNFICYFQDTLKTAQYLFILIFMVLLLIKISNVPKILYNHILGIGCISYFFWSLIGWYPPIRFNIYSIGILLLLIFSTQILFLKNYLIRNISVFILIIYFYNLSHWNVF